MVELKQITPTRLRDRFRLHNTSTQDAVPPVPENGDRSSSRSSDPPSIELSTRSQPRSSGSTATAWDPRASIISKGKKSITSTTSLEIPAFLTPGGATPLASPMTDERSAFFSKGTPIDRLGPFGLIEAVPRSKPTYNKPPAYSKYLGGAEPPSKHLKIQKKKKWYGHWSTRKIILASLAGIILVILIVGLAAGLVLSEKANHVQVTPTWRPAIETTWQMQLNGTVSNPSLRAALYDIDLFSTTSEEIANMHTLGRRVICYFAVGIYESFRSDANTFPDSSLGNYLNGSTTERYIDTRSQAIQNIMKARIDMAVEKGCDGLDVGHLDSYLADSSFPLTTSTATTYLTYLSTQSHNVNTAIGVRNCPEIVSDSLLLVDYEINENCVAYSECGIYQPFISAGKPVLHIEYMSQGNNTADFLNWACNGNGTRGFSTIVKRVDLGAWALDCPLGLPGYGFY